MAPRGRIERWFEFGERGATWRGEITGGATTFLTMAYISSFSRPFCTCGGRDWPLRISVSSRT